METFNRFCKLTLNEYIESCFIEVVLKHELNSFSTLKASATIYLCRCRQDWLDAINPLINAHGVLK